MLIFEFFFFLNDKKRVGFFLCGVGKPTEAFRDVWHQNIASALRQEG